MNTPRARIFPPPLRPPVEQLKHDIDQAIAWGTPDNESIGMSSSAFIQILVRAKRYITKLEDHLINEDRLKTHNARLRSQLQALCNAIEREEQGVHEAAKARALLEELKS
jgi:hypothetical protein